MLPGQSHPWLLLHAQGDPIAYFNVECGRHVQVDISGRHFYEDKAVLSVLHALRGLVGGIVHDDRYPKSWTTLKHPGQRDELLYYLECAQSPEMYLNTTELEFLIHFIFDDHDFQPTSRQRGLTLLDDHEVAAVASFVSALDCAVGSRTKPLSHVSAADWAPVSEAARLARDRLLLRAEPWSESSASKGK